jgi:origin recognition complex subunit 1
MTFPAKRKAPYKGGKPHKKIKCKEHDLNYMFDKQLLSYRQYLNNQSLILMHESGPKKQWAEAPPAHPHKLKKLSGLQSDEIQEIRAKLSLNYIPETLLCRERECAEIKDYILNGIAKKSSLSSLYISGMPGTGKTACVEQVIRELSNKEDDFNNKCLIIKLNGMTQSNSYQIYSVIHDRIFSDKKQICPTTALHNLTKYFTLKKVPKGFRENKKIKLLILDEMDGLIVRRQNILYHIFEWSTQPDSKLVIIGIANTMSLPETLDSKVASRIGKLRLVFQPYTTPQITEIIKSRLANTNIFASEAITLVSKKIASISGDIRRTLNLCNRAMDRCIAQGKDKVTLNDILSVESDIKSSRQYKAIKALSPSQLACIMAIAIERSKSEDKQSTTINKLLSRYSVIKELLKMEPNIVLNHIDVKTLLIKLSNRGIVSLKDNRISTLIYNDELMFAVSDASDPRLREYLQNELACDT